eukprot:TRINITY_DN5869_c0_g2_i1.p1 TRINITY_DN5869_c0_g2~~TRINITY_DN5869_c0_g2_i1.p1  ORF type:complete len:272 (-),score=45.81 TRINITY_DN5869_c0_g2_i1:781-1596(-)
MGLILNKLSYMPPPPGYYLKDGKVFFRNWLKTLDADSESFRFIKTTSNRSVATLMIRHPQARQTIVYSHGNVEDLGTIRPLLNMISIDLQVNIVCYDYAGYGLSEGIPSEITTYEDLEAVCNFVFFELNIHPKSTILLGRSLGSGPTCEYAFKNHEKIGGVIIQSGFMSAMKTVSFSLGNITRLDAYRNYEKAAQIHCPVYFIHGSADDIISCEHAKALAELCPGLWRCWIIEGANHNNIESMCGPSYLANLRGFLLHVFTIRQSMTGAAR